MVEKRTRKRLDTLIKEANEPIDFEGMSEQEFQELAHECIWLFCLPFSSLTNVENSTSHKERKQEDEASLYPDHRDWNVIDVLLTASERSDGLSKEFVELVMKHFVKPIGTVYQNL